MPQTYEEYLESCKNHSILPMDESAFNLISSMFSFKPKESTQLSETELLAQARSDYVELKKEFDEQLQLNLKLFNQGVQQGRGQVQDDIDATEKLNNQILDENTLLKAKLDLLDDIRWQYIAVPRGATITIKKEA